MQHTINVKAHRIFIVILLFIYIFYLFIDKGNYFKTKIPEEITFLNSIKNDTNINVLILGGSNALRGISAEQLSVISDFNVRNFSKSSEAGSIHNYKMYLENLSKRIYPSKVKLILYSSSHIYNNNSNTESNRYFENDFLLSYNKTNILLPKISLLSFLKMQANPVLESQNKYGDYLFNQSQILNNLAGRFHFNMPDLDSSISIILTGKKIFNELFPNAKLIVLPPPLYVDNLSVLNSFYSKLTERLKKHNIEILVPKMNYQNSTFWEDDWHLNSSGRVVRTKEIYENIRKIK